ncbi:MAG: LysR family transcriptional regulator [Rhodoferax sp.]|jgi:LysR family glycine cleavage system transcriptional activator|nr:LysR family transcriptional regulator [Rhodoferax sp.]
MALPPRPTRLPLNTLPAFRAAARLENLRAAADELHLTHSAVSQQIKQLEDQLGLVLFDRRGRRLALNAAGAALQRAVEQALDRLGDGVREAQEAGSGAAPRLRLSVLPSFAQRWLLPRMGRWHAQHPDITLEVRTSQAVVDLAREGFHAGLRVGVGPWRGLQAERLLDATLIAVAAPGRAARLADQGAAALANEPLLGGAEEWSRWLALAGVTLRAQPVADFNDAGLMLQATEQDLGLALVRELLAADALLDGRLVRLPSPPLSDADSATYWIVYPPELADWGPMRALRNWLHEEMALSRAALAEG